ncbi:aspartic peptidase domain-containing protein [Crassisporium funariophilum]|nr:aspartic peptidase domain-containing protein [Crassisporium funariophilum]
MMFNVAVTSQVLSLLLSLSTFGTGASGFLHRRRNVHGETKPRGVDIPIMMSTSRTPQFSRRGNVGGSIGLGNNGDLLYTVPIELGNNVVAVNLDTGSSDLWVVSDTCQTNSCKGANVARYPQASLVATGANVDMFYGDSTTGTYASGAVGLDTATIAGIAMTQQAFGLINDTTNAIVEFETAGIFGLSFPSASRVQEAFVEEKTGPIVETDDFVMSTYTSGPLLSRIAMTGALDQPIFSITLQRNTIDVSGLGLLTIGKLPDGVDNSSLTWVPVRLYSDTDGGLPAPSSAPDEIYPFRWEIDIDAVYLDGQKLPDSTIPAKGVDSQRVSALIDTGNSILRGPSDVVDQILSTVSTSYDPKAQDPVAALPCNVPRQLTFEIGGKMFPIDPRDFIGQLNTGDAVTCQADNIIATDPPSIGALFRWSLGTPFFRSNLVVFHYGNLTNPSVDPPRIGILSNVPSNANQLLQDAVQNALSNGGNFPNSLHAAPTASAATETQITVSQGFSATATPAPTLAITTLSLGAPPNSPTSAPKNTSAGLPSRVHTPANQLLSTLILTPVFVLLSCCM